MLRLLLVDDEPLARLRLRTLLATITESRGRPFSACPSCSSLSPPE